MADACGHVYDKLLPEAAPCAIETVTDGTPEPTTRKVHHVLSDGNTLKKRKRTDEPSTSKNAARMRAKRKDPEYRKREMSGAKFKEWLSARVRRKALRCAFLNPQFYRKLLKKSVIGRAWG